MGFKAEKKGDINIIMAPEEVDAISVKLFTSQVKEWIVNSSPLTVFDFRETKFIYNTFYRPVVLFSQGLKAEKKSLMSINMSPTIQKQIENDGLNGVLNPMKSLQEAVQKAGLKPIASGGSVINADFISPFFSSAQMVLKVQAKTAAHPEKPFLKKESLPYEIGIAGVISLVSDQFNGSVALCFPTNVFLNIYTNMLGETVQEISEEVESAIGELLNIIYGQVKATLNNKKGFTIRSAIPTVLSGQKLHISGSSKGTTIILPFKTDAGPFHIEVTAEAPTGQ